MHTREQIDANIAAHARVALRYAKTHGEIYNDVEQARLSAALRNALDQIRSCDASPRALDFGCGAGNLTDHLIAQGARAVSADVSPEFLRLVHRRHGDGGMCETALLNGQDLRQFSSGSLDFAGTYSVLHHVPDYLGAVKEMARVLRPGGVLYIDHEHAPAHWHPAGEYAEYLAQVSPRRSLVHRLTNLLRPEWYVLRLRLLANPRYQPEGDIHVWPDDHIDWEKITGLLTQEGVEVLERQDYLLYRRHCPVAVYEKYKGHCADMRMLVARKSQK